jgi:hypothetical protein
MPAQLTGTIRNPSGLAALQAPVALYPLTYPMVDENGKLVSFNRIEFNTNAQGGIPLGIFLVKGDFEVTVRSRSWFKIRMTAGTGDVNIATIML